MVLHRVTIASAWRPDVLGRPRRQFIAQCICGWSAGWLTTRIDAADAGDEHRSVAAVASRIARAAAAVGDHPGPAA
jgi:hypothetical protein